jgi:sulfite exporter TauE/SafE
MLIALTTGATFGLLNWSHCAGMCGPLSSMVCVRAGRPGLFRYQLGRTLGYGGAGALCGHLGQSLAVAASVPAMRWMFTGLAAVACLFAALSLLRDRTPTVKLRLSRRVPAGLSAALGRILPREPLSLGVLSVLLPCGLLAAALLSAVATGDGAHGAALMAGFAVSTGCSLLGVGWFAQVTSARVSKLARKGMAVLLLAAAIVMVARPLVVATAPTDPPSSLGAGVCCH